jgi:hypothetical protein
MHLAGFFVVLVWQAREEFAHADRQVSRCYLTFGRSSRLATNLC